jgi:hypothetical protein
MYLENLIIFMNFIYTIFLNEDRISHKKNRKMFQKFLVTFFFLVIVHFQI